MRILVIFGAALALVAVMLGAFAAHGLKSMLSVGELATFDIGVRYQFYHAIAILLLPGLLAYGRGSLLIKAGWLFVAGILLFSGSLYVLATTGLRFFGPITPLGGVFMMLGWATVIAAVVKQGKATDE
jgi:uncharacterized membrane protein YgdD (TMEM256/DUF423 family)